MKTDRSVSELSHIISERQGCRSLQQTVHFVNYLCYGLNENLMTKSSICNNVQPRSWGETTIFNIDRSLSERSLLRLERKFDDKVINFLLRLFHLKTIFITVQTVHFMNYLHPGRTEIWWQSHQSSFKIVSFENGIYIQIVHFVNYLYV